MAAVRPPAHPVYDFDVALVRRERLEDEPDDLRAEEPRAVEPL